MIPPHIKVAIVAAGIFCVVQGVRLGWSEHRAVMGATDWADLHRRSRAAARRTRIGFYFPAALTAAASIWSLVHYTGHL